MWSLRDAQIFFDDLVPIVIMDINVDKHGYPQLVRKGPDAATQKQLLEPLGIWI